MVPPERPPEWIWIMVGVLAIIAFVLLAGQAGLAIPKRKEKLE